MQTLQDLLPELSRLSRREAVRWTNGFRTIVTTYGELHDLIATAVAYFDAHTIAKGDRVLIWAENRAEWVAVFWACVARGIEAVRVVFGFSPDRLQRTRSKSRPKLTIDQAVLAATGPSKRVAAFK